MREPEWLPDRIRNYRATLRVLAVRDSKQAAGALDGVAPQTTAIVTPAHCSGSSRACKSADTSIPSSPVFTGGETAAAGPPLSPLMAAGHPLSPLRAAGPAWPLLTQSCDEQIQRALAKKFKRFHRHTSLWHFSHGIYNLYE